MLIAHDLRALTAHLSRFGQHKKLTAAVERAFSVSSAQQDLAQAHESLALLNRLSADNGWEREFSPHDAGLVAGSLFNSAIILYARATETKPVGRTAWFGTGKLSAEDRELHRTVMWIRNKELAHFGSGRPIDGTPMIEETIALVSEEDRAKVSYCTSRARNRVKFALDVQVLTKAVLTLAHTASMARLDELGTELKLAFDADPTLASKVLRFQVSARLMETIQDYRAPSSDLDDRGSTNGRTKVRSVRP